MKSKEADDRFVNVWYSAVPPLLEKVYQTNSNEVELAPWCIDGDRVLPAMTAMISLKHN